MTVYTASAQNPIKIQRFSNTVCTKSHDFQLQLCIPFPIDASPEHRQNRKPLRVPSVELDVALAYARPDIPAKYVRRHDHHQRLDGHRVRTQVHGVLLVLLRLQPQTQSAHAGGDEQDAQHRCERNGVSSKLENVLLFRAWLVPQLVPRPNNSQEQIHEEVLQSQENRALRGGAHRDLD